MFANLKTKSFGSWDTSHWDVVFGKLDGHIKVCSFSSKILKQWKKVLHHIQWRGRNLESGNTLRLERLHWSVILPWSLPKQEPRKAYFLAMKGLTSITDVVNDQGQLLGFNDITCRYSIGPHHCVICNKVTELILSLVPVPPLGRLRIGCYKNATLLLLA